MFTTEDPLRPRTTDRRGQFEAYQSLASRYGF
jgi:hypothetical protein